MKKETLQKQRVRFITNAAYWAVILALIYFVFKYLIRLIMPFFIALIIASLGRPIARILSAETKTGKDRYGNPVTVPRKVRLNYNFAAVVSVIAVFLIVLGLLSIVAIPLINYMIRVFTAVPEIYENSILPGLSAFLKRAAKLPAQLQDPLKGILEGVIPNLITSLGSFVTNLSGKLLGGVSSLVTSLPSKLLTGLITLIGAVFIAIDYDRMLSFTKLNLKNGTLRVVTDVKDSLVDIVWQFIKSYFLIFLITTTEIAVGLTILGRSNPLLFGALIAIFDAFPIVGSGMILMPWAVITMVTSSVWKGIGLFVLYLVVVIARQIIEPKIVGKHVGLRPIVTLFCMTIGTKLFGVLGLFGLPIAAAIITDLNDSGAVRLYHKASEDTENDEEEEIPD